MIVADLDIIGIAIVKAKTDTPLIVDGDRILPLSVAGQRMEPIARRGLQIRQAGGQIDVLKLSRCPTTNVRGEAPGLARCINSLRLAVCEGFYHEKRM